MTLYELIKDRRYRKRLKEILLVFSEQEFGFLISKLKLGHHLPFSKRLRARISKERGVGLPVRLRKAFEKLGPTFIKLGQLLSLRPDLLPIEYVKEFEKMQDEVQIFPFSQAKEIIEKEFGQPLDKVFISFNKKPVASASIAQVYKAKTKKGEVAVKVQRPGIKKIVEVDIEIMYKLVGTLEHHVPELKNFYLKSVIHEFEKWTIKEMNFKIEAHHAQKISENLGRGKFFKIPKVHLPLTTEKVLVTEYVEGTPLHEIEKLKRKKINLDKVFRNCYYLFLKQIFVNGLFHADPHSGNILVLDDGKICLVDFGIVGRFDEKLKRNTLNLFRSIVDNDPEKATKTLLRMGLTDGLDEETFQSDVGDIFERFQFTSLKDLEVSRTLEELVSLINRHHLKIPLDFVLFEKTIITLEGLALRYRADFNLVKESKKDLDKLVGGTYLAKEMVGKVKTKVSEYYELADLFPSYAKEILEKAKRFKIGVDIEDSDLRSLMVEMEHSSGNVSLGLMIAALIVGSALVFQTSDGAALPIVGFSLAGVLGLWLMYRIFFKTQRQPIER